MLGAVAASVIGKEEAELRSMLVPAIWGLNSEEDVGLVWMMVNFGYEQMINEVTYEVDRLTKAWMLGDTTVSAPPEVNVDRSEFSRYRLTQLLKRTAGWRRINEEHSEPEPDMANYNQGVVLDMVRVMMIAHEFLNKGDPDMALDWYRGAVSVLDNDGLSDTADAELLLAEIAYYIGSVTRQLGRLEEAIQWGNFALKVNGRKAIVSHADQAVLEQAKDGRWKALEMMGNCYFDQQHFTTSYRYHLDALLARLDLDSANTDCRAALNAVDALPQVSSSIVHSVFNLGNSIGNLNDDDLYETARTTVILAAARMPDLERFATWPEGRHVLGGLLAIFEVQLYSDDPAVNHALSRVQSAFGANPPSIENYIRHR
jgi:tetratricopeptide (TPR) repeat protein